MENKVNSHILRISGSVELPQALTSGYNYSVKIEGSVPKIEMVDNEDSTFDVIYKMKPVRVEVITETGETLKAKDPRGNGEKARSQARAIYLDKGLTIPFETFYDAISAQQRHVANEVAEKLIKDNEWM